MTQDRLDHLMLLHSHKDIIDSIQLSDVANRFVSNSKQEKVFFEKF